MTTFEYRDGRRGRISIALALLHPGTHEDLRSTLEQELEALAGDDWTVTDRTYWAVAEDWLWSVRLFLKDSVDADPVFQALGATSSLTPVQAAAIENVPHGPGGPPADYLARVRAIVGDDPAVLTQLLHAAHWYWLAQPSSERSHPFDDVGVLLPLRLETLFDEPASRYNEDPARWKLSLRVVPDEASVRRDDRHVSAGERSAIEAFWRDVRQPGDVDPTWLDGDGAGTAWARLCAQVAPPRAAWLVAALVPTVDGDDVHLDLPADMPPDPEPNRVGGLPPRLAVWAVVRGDPARHLVGRLPMDPAAEIDVAALALPLPNSPDGTREAWWSSWETATTVGMAGEWPLDDGLTPDTLEALYVVGIGDETPDAHLRAQIDAGELGVLPLGAPTNTVHGAPAADLATDAGTWRVVARTRLRQAVGGMDPGSVGGVLERQLTGGSGVLPFFPAADAPDDTRDSQRIAQALWPALFGHWLADVWGQREDAYRVGRWAFPLADDDEPDSDEVRRVLDRPWTDPWPAGPPATFCPEGPLMPLRIGDQPYGLLPVTALSRWQREDSFTAEQHEQHRVEAAAAAALTGLRARWAEAGRRSGTVVGASTAGFVDVLGRAASGSRYIGRSFAPATAWTAPYQLGPDDLDRFNELTHELYGPALDVVQTLPDPLYLANGYWQENTLPLVQPSAAMYRHRGGTERTRVALTRFLALLVAQTEPEDLRDVFARYWVLDDSGEYLLGSLPDSLAIRLLVHTCQVDADWLSDPSLPPVALPVLRGHLEAVHQVSSELDTRSWNLDDRDPETGEARFPLTIPAGRRGRLEGALRATLDCAAARIDPWITGFAWQRLQTSSASRRSAHRLGAYGWVDGPFPGPPGPTEAGRLHTPSSAQTLAAVVLRDAFLSAERAGRTNQDQRNPWEMSIDSARARLADEVAEEVRLGFSIHEIVGRHVEDVVADHQQVKALRTGAQYAMRPERRDPTEVCNGVAALPGLLAGDPQFPLDADQRAALQALHEALDTYGDLLLADGVMQLVDRQSDRAAETMDAAAGFSRPPSFEFLRTPPSGYQLESMVLAAVPYVPVESVPADGSPIALADPSLAAFVTETVGADWTWTAVNDDDGAQLGSAGMADLGLTVVDTLTLSSDLLAELARRFLRLPKVSIVEGHTRCWTVTDPAGAELGVVSLADLRLLPGDLAGLTEADLAGRVRAHLGAPGDSIVREGTPDDPRVWIATDDQGVLLGAATVATLGMTPAEITALDRVALHRRVRLALGLADVRILPPPEHARAQQLAAALGNRPATGRDLVRDPEAQRSQDAAVYAELSARYVAVYQAGRRLLEALRGADDAARPALLRRAMGWGITPVSAPADREAFFAALVGVSAAAGATASAVLAETAATALQARLDAAPSPEDLAPAAALGAPLPDAVDRKRRQHPDGVPSLAEALANLAAPEGRLAVLACWERAQLLDVSGLATGSPDDELDTSWLTLLAAVRPALARLEALQLGLDTPLTAWSSSPGDPFRTGLVDENQQLRATRSPLAMTLRVPFVATYGPAGTWSGDRVAVGLVDSFTEAVPMPQRTTMAAFGFNAPAARAPQAILLAVPPGPRQRLDEDLVLQILDETRELAHARTASVADLGDLQLLVPTVWLQSSGPSRVRLEPYPLFT